MASLDLLKGALNRLYAFSPELRSKLPEQGIRIAAWSDVPRQSGLGGSSLLVTLALAALRQFYSLDRRTHNDYILCELTQNVEALELGITCGFADRYVPLFGGLAYLDYRGKLHQAPLRSEPLVTYERLDPYIEPLPLVAITTGVQHNSGDVHGRMRPRYLQEFNAWNGSGGDPPPLVRTMQCIYETAWRGKIALLEGDLDAFGRLMNTNHRLIDEMMTLCGFVDGAGGPTTSSSGSPWRTAPWAPSSPARAAAAPSSPSSTPAPKTAWRKPGSKPLSRPASSPPASTSLSSAPRV